MNILVTGGAGYIGSHACQLLARKGFRPVVYDNLSCGHRELAKWGDLVVADLHDNEALESAFARYRPEAVLHFAASAYVGESFEQPARYFENNVGGTLRLLRAMRNHQVGRLVFSSTCAIYGTPRSLPIAEDSPQHPENPYGWSKLMAEQVLRDHSTAYGLNAVMLRYFNACGADPGGETGELHDPEPHLIPRTLDAAAGSGSVLDIYGTDYPTRDGTCVRDYIHVSDLAEAHIAALRLLLNGAGTMALNLGIGQGFTVREVIRAVERVTGLPAPVRESGRRPGDPAELVADSRRAAEVLNFRPRFTGLDDMVRTAWNWKQQRGKRISA